MMFRYMKALLSRPTSAFVIFMLLLSVGTPAFFKIASAADSSEKRAYTEYPPEPEERQMCRAILGHGAVTWGRDEIYHRTIGDEFDVELPSEFAKLDWRAIGPAADKAEIDFENSGRPQTVFRISLRKDGRRTVDPVARDWYIIAAPDELAGLERQLTMLPDRDSHPEDFRSALAMLSVQLRHNGKPIHLSPEAPSAVEGAPQAKTSRLISVDDVERFRGVSANSLVFEMGRQIYLLVWAPLGPHGDFGPVAGILRPEKSGGLTPICSHYSARSRLEWQNGGAVHDQYCPVSLRDPLSVSAAQAISWENIYPRSADEDRVSLAIVDLPNGIRTLVTIVATVPNDDGSPGAPATLENITLVVVHGDVREAIKRNIASHRPPEDGLQVRYPTTSTGPSAFFVVGPRLIVQTTENSPPEMPHDSPFQIRYYDASGPSDRELCAFSQRLILPLPEIENAEETR